MGVGHSELQGGASLSIQASFYVRPHYRTFCSTICYKVVFCVPTFVPQFATRWSSTQYKMSDLFKTWLKKNKEENEVTLKKLKKTILTSTLLLHLLMMKKSPFHQRVVECKKMSLYHRLVEAYIQSHQVQ